MIIAMIIGIVAAARRLQQSPVRKAVRVTR